MPISSENRKSGPFLGTGAVSEYPFDFTVFGAEDLLVIKADESGADSTLVLDSDFTVDINADQDASPGGTVTLSSPLPADHRLVITSDIAALQPTDLTNQGGFYPRVVNAALDRLTILVQQLTEQVSRSLKVSITSDEEATPDALVAQINAVAEAVSEFATSDTKAAPFYVEKESGIEVDFGVRGYAVGPVIHGYMANGTKASPTSITSGQLIFGIGSRPYAGTGFTAHSTSAIHMVSTENHSGTNQGTDFRILVTPVGKTEADRITAVRYYAPANGLRIRHRMHGTDTDRAKYQTDVDGENTSFIVIPATSGLASNVQVRSSDTADFSRGYIQATNTAVELISDAGGAGTVRPLTVKVGATTTQTHNTDGSITNQAGTRLGSDAPSLRVKKLTGTTSASAGAITSIPHGLTGANIRGIIVEVRPAADLTQGFPPGVSFAPLNRQYEAYFGTSNVAITTHPTNSSSILSSPITVLVIYEA